MELPALTTHRIQTIVKQLDLGPVIQENDDSILRFNNAHFVFSWLEQIQLFRIHGYWAGRATDVDTHAKLTEFVRKKNHVLPCPRFHAIISDQGEMHVGFQYYMPARTGLSDAQITNIIAMVMGNTSAAMDELETVAPELVTWESSELSQSAGDEQ